MQKKNCFLIYVYNILELLASIEALYIASS